jgi:hypothetical protein
MCHNHTENSQLIIVHNEYKKNLSSQKRPVDMSF